MKTFACILIGAVAISGCKDKSDGGAPAAKPAEPATPDKPVAAAPAKAPPPSGPVKLDKLGLQIDIPGGAQEVSAGVTADSLMVRAASTGVFFVSLEKSPDTLDKAKKNASDYTPKNLDADKLTDGWTLTFDNVGTGGANFFVQVRRDLGGASYSCHTTANTAALAQSVLAVCKTLRK